MQKKNPEKREHDAGLKGKKKKEKWTRERQHGER